tara:strand:+ start:3576 stop:4073 length:498 start_codon:yes stop_codon:yes gene_type:complete
MLNTRIDQIDLLKSLLTNTNDNNKLSVAYSAWAAVYTCGSEYLKNLMLELINEPTASQKRDIEFAVARMGVTNPYFVARQYVDIAEGGTLEALNFRAFATLAIENETQYHHACVAISLINGGHMCLRSHVSSLQHDNESDKNIDISMRIAAVCHSLSIMDKSSNI